ncbi:galactose-3-o-sulfotransferase 3 [Plakobranchus ocellatus]|uniref:Galactose-3-o-sulfotransferase 3 n=1 Tax=Plakobranchus ocellatus TaxID=259542 RepID=A0AAV3ZIQ1_9GAST|nr:galactose-3-o-sulfotransferase 3 [Plakobranchus ocellatus]
MDKKVWFGLPVFFAAACLWYFLLINRSTVYVPPPPGPLPVIRAKDVSEEEIWRLPSKSFKNVSQIRQVVFAKVHKAASSTVQNILLRFAMARDLDILLPTQGPIINETGSTIRPEKIIPHPLGKLFDILCTHVVYTKQEIGRYFSNSTVRVTMIREPMQHAISALHYYTTVFPQKGYVAGVKKHPNDPVNGFVHHPEDFYPYPSHVCAEPGSYISNRMSYDLGFDADNFAASKKNDSKIQIFVNELEKEFHFVLISDYFDESMVLLKRVLGWTVKDIIYLKVNIGEIKNTSVWNHKPQFDSQTFEAFRECNKLDYELYDHFLPLFLDKIQKQPNFKEEVSYFKQLQERVREFCLESVIEKTLNISESKWSKQFTVSTTDCKLMKTAEKEMVELARKKQLKRYAVLKKILSNSNVT